MEKVNTGVYLTRLQLERVQAMAQAQKRSVSKFLGILIDRAWTEYIEEKNNATEENENTFAPSA